MYLVHSLAATEETVESSYIEPQEKGGPRWTEKVSGWGCRNPGCPE